MGRMDADPTGRRLMPPFDPAEPKQARFVSYGPAPIPDPRDISVDMFVQRVRSVGPNGVSMALANVSEGGRKVLRAYAERSASVAVRDIDEDRLVSALVALVIGGLDQNIPEALMVLALVDDASRRIGSETSTIFGRAADIVGHPGQVNLMIWLTRKDEDRTPESMGFTAAADSAGFRYEWMS